MGGLVRVVRRHRRGLAFVCAFVGVLFGLAALREEPAEWAGLVVNQDLPAGHLLSPGDVQVVGLSAAAQPANAMTSPAEVNGRVLAGAMVAGEMVLDSRLVGPGLLDGSPPGHVAMPLRLEDPGEASFLQPGDRVDVLAARRTSELNPTTGGTEEEAAPPVAQIVARDVVVLAIPATGPTGAAGLLSGASAASASGSALVVSVAQTQATEIAGAATNARLSVVLRPP